eukprot:gnl/MRDRNA2_/MRDRNA2_156189_c0_seq1.p1 gnl/MRDRNA2_/MRDRNA2_156189_c0~~gnl/MRDRNA2_/MRDRNA2_156189_c0_seq1.p1  ORF type:complete len:566 (-),score=67.70 gnl/MRDRNA2_/MRDRNA2_156189_c0_seq1:84-1781(-)
MFHSRVAIAMMLLGIAAYPLLLQLIGVCSINHLRLHGWVFPTEQASGPVWYERVGMVYQATVPNVVWSVVAQQVPSILGLWLVHALCALMDLRSIETLTKVEIDLDAELRTIGVSNVFSALSGAGWPVYVLLSQNVTCYKLGGRTKIVGLLVFLSTIADLFAVQYIVPCFPHALPGCVAWWLGLVFSKETFVDIFRRHVHKSDVLIVCVMAIVIVGIGFLEGILVGLLISMGSFTLKYTGASAVVRTMSDGSFLRSNTGRPLAQQEFLARLGHRIAVLHVDGYLMFGSSPHLTMAVRPLLEPGGPDWIVLSFRGVSGVDYSAVLDLAGLGRRAASAKCCLVLTQLPDAVVTALSRANVKLPSAQHEGVGLCHVEHYNAALQFCEDALLATALSPALELPELQTQACSMKEKALKVLTQTLGFFLESHTDLLQLLSFFEEVEYPPEAVVWQQGEPCTFCLLVIEGRLHSMQEPTRSGSRAFLQEVVEPGNFIGYMGIMNQMVHVSTMINPGNGNMATPCMCLMLSQRSLQSLLDSHVTLANAILRSFLRRSAYEWREMSRLVASAT